MPTMGFVAGVTAVAFALPAAQWSGASTLPPTEEENGSYQVVEFETRDGEARTGRLFGDGRVAVILTHMGRPEDSPDDWESFAVELADEGYQVMTHDRPGRRTGVWEGVLDAADYLSTHGAETVIAAGASIGAMGSLHAATQEDSNLHGVIWFAGVLNSSGFHFSEEDVDDLACPLLLITGDRDTYGAAEDTRQLHEWVTAPSELIIVDSALHGTDILAQGGAPADQVRQAMIDFVDQAASEPTPC